MKEKDIEQIALFKYIIISPLIAGIENEITKKEFFMNAASKKYKYINGELISLSWGTIERWYYDYLKGGFEALKPKRRADYGKNRKISYDLACIINHYVDTHKRLPATVIKEALIENGYILPNEVSLSTITRYINLYKRDRQIINSKEMKRYEVEHINDVWCCDTTYSFKLNVNGELKRTYIIAIIDDASRLIVGCDVFFNDNYINYMSVLKRAVKRYGKPKMLNLDNGASYKNGQIELLSARLGIILHHCAPYTPEAKSKIERWFRTMKDHFMAKYNLTSKTTLEEYRSDLLKYIEEYNNKKHSSLKEKTPNERFFNSDDEIIYLNDDLIETSFLIEVERKVTADGIVMLDTKEFEVPYQYQNKKIKVRYSSDYKTVYVVETDNTLTPINIVDKIANSKIKRKNINYNLEEE